MRSIATDVSIEPAACRLRRTLDDIERRMPGAFAGPAARRIRTSQPVPHSTPDLLIPILGHPGEPRPSSMGLHEWFGIERAPGQSDPQSWFPPLTILVHLAARALEMMKQWGRRGGVERSGERVAWVGRRIWPSAMALAPTHLRPLIDRSILVDAQSVQQRVWAMDVALRSPAIAIVIGDASSMAMADTRRLALSASRALCLTARPVRELKQLSAARTRWLTHPHPSISHRFSEWSVDLLRCKGLRPTSEEARALLVRVHHETGDVRVLPHPADRRAASA